MIRAASVVLVAFGMMSNGEQYGQQAAPSQGYAQPAQQYAQPAAYPQQGYQQPAYPQQGGYAQPAPVYQQPQYPAPAPAQQYVAPAPATQAPYTEPPKYVEPANVTYPTEAPKTAPPPFVAPGEAYPVYEPAETCTETCKPNSAKYMAYVCSSLYASALKWGNNNCKGYYDVVDSYDSKSLYQAQLCTYWTQRSVMRVVTSCFIEAHLRNEFVMKYGKQGAGVWFCKYKAFVDQVRDCYKSSLKYYPLGESLNSIESQVAALYSPNKDDMPPFEFTGASVAMCAYYNKDQVYNRAAYQ